MTEKINIPSSIRGYPDITGTGESATWMTARAQLRCPKCGSDDVICRQRPHRHTCFHCDYEASFRV